MDWKVERMRVTRAYERSEARCLMRTCGREFLDARDLGRPNKGTLPVAARQGSRRGRGGSDRR